MCIFQSFQKFTKIIPLVLFFEEAPGSTWGWPVGHPRVAPHRPARPARGGAPPCCVGPSLPHLFISSSHSLLYSEKTRTSFLSLAFLLKSSRFLDLFAQPRFMSEIWHICSPVCDSSDYPSRILFGWVYLEYFAAVGNMFSELACLF